MSKAKTARDRIIETWQGQEVPMHPKTGNYGLHVVRVKLTDVYFVKHDGMLVRPATEDEIHVWHLVVQAQMDFEITIQGNGKCSRYV